MNKFESCLYSFNTEIICNLISVKESKYIIIHLDHFKDKN